MVSNRLVIRIKKGGQIMSVFNKKEAKTGGFQQTREALDSIRGKCIKVSVDKWGDGKDF